MFAQDFVSQILLKSVDVTHS